MTVSLGESRARVCGWVPSAGQVSLSASVGWGDTAFYATLLVGLRAMPFTAESPHREAAGIEEGKGPIAPPARGHNGGRKASNARKEFTAVPDVGGTCSHCHMLVKTTAPRRRGHNRECLQRRQWGRGQHARRLSTKPRPLMRHDGKLRKGMIIPTAVDAIITDYS